MKKVYAVLLLTPFWIYANNLKELIIYAQNNNNLTKSMSYNAMSKENEIVGVERSYFPTVDIGASYQSIDPKSPFQAGQTTLGFVKAGIDLYDGGKRKYQILQKTNELEALNLDKEGFKKSVSLSVVENFFALKNISSTQDALEQKKIYIEKELNRVKRFYSAGLTTQDVVKSVEASLYANNYDLDSLKTSYESKKNTLELLTNRRIFTLERGKIQEPKNVSMQSNEKTKSLKASNQSLESVREGLDSATLPIVKFEDTYTKYKYADSAGAMGLFDSQNKISLSLNMRIFDNGVQDAQKESILSQQQAMLEKIEQEELSQQSAFATARENLMSSKSKIQSASSALVSASSALTLIQRKLSVSLATNSEFLDALSKKTVAKANYEMALNDYEVAKANYYFQAGVNLEEFIDG